MSDTAVADNAAKAVKHATRAAEAAVEPAKDLLVEVGKAKWITGRNALIAVGAILVAGTAVVAVKRVRAMKAGNSYEIDPDD